MSTAQSETFCGGVKFDADFGTRITDLWMKTSVKHNFFWGFVTLKNGWKDGLNQAFRGKWVWGVYG